MADFIMLATAPVNALAGLAAHVSSRVVAAVVTRQLPLYGAQNMEVVCATRSFSSTTSVESLSDIEHVRARSDVRVEIIGSGENVVGYGVVQCSDDADQSGDAAIRATQVVWESHARNSTEHRSDSESGVMLASSPLTGLVVATLRFHLAPGVAVYGFTFAD